METKKQSSQMQVEEQLIAEILNLDKKEEQLDYFVQIDNPKLFTNEKIVKILYAMGRVIVSGKIADMVTVFQELKGEVPDAYYAKLAMQSHSSALINDYITILKERKYKKDVEDILKTQAKKVKESTDFESVDKAKNEILAELGTLEIGAQSEFISFQEYKQKIRAQLSSRKEIEGFSWGVSDLDTYTSGIQVPLVYVIGGLKKAGKTRFLIFILKSLYKQGVPSVFLSLEVPAYEITKLLHAAFIGINDVRLRSSSFLNREELYEFDQVNIEQELMAVECKSGLDVNQVVARIRRYAKLGYKVVMIDYLQRIKHDRNRQAQELESISIALADAARQNKVALIILSQLNASAENGVPNMGNLKGSGGVGESPDTIILFDNIYRRTKVEGNKNKVDLILEQRYGDSGAISVWADLGACHFENIKNKEAI